jgi:hypothetical protein
LCEHEAAAIKALGETVARALIVRLADLEAASSPLELPLAGPEDTAMCDETSWRIALADGYLLVVAVNHDPIPRTDDGKVYWHRIRRIKLLEIIKNGD